MARCALTDRKSGTNGAPRSAGGRTRSIAAGACALGAMYIAFAVGTPWLLHDAPPDSYAAIATQAACTAAADARSHCAQDNVLVR